MTVAPASARIEHRRRVACPDCGESRWLSARNARKVETGESSGRCRSCLYGPRRPLTERQRTHYLRWWLERCDDQQLARIASGMNGHSVAAVDVARLRVELLPTGSRRELEPAGRKLR